MHRPCSNVIARPREMHQNKNTVHLPHINAAIPINQPAAGIKQKTALNSLSSEDRNMHLSQH